MLNTLLISTYDQGHQPFGLASPAAWLAEAGARVSCLDLAVQPLDEALVRRADLVAFFLPMHTATRLAVPIARRVRVLNPGAHLCFYGLYAVLNEAYLRRIGADSILSGEYESGLRDLARHLQAERPLVQGNTHPVPRISLARQRFRLPDRANLPPLNRYAHVHLPGGEIRPAGYTQATRGCKHHCRHCPIVPVYNGRFRVIDQEIVLGDIRQQVAAGAAHITFGDPDFFNGIGHALPLVRKFAQEFPEITFDVTIKIEHLLKYATHLETLRDSGCLFITSAFESFDDQVLAILAKGHTRADALQAFNVCRQVGIALQPTFIAFHPWMNLCGYQDMLAILAEEGLVEQISPIQLAIRLLIPRESRLLDLPEVQRLIEPFDEAALVYPWKHPDPQVDALQAEVHQLIAAQKAAGAGKMAIFKQVWDRSAQSTEQEPAQVPTSKGRPAQTPIPFLSEPWYC